MVLSFVIETEQASCAIHQSEHTALVTLSLADFLLKPSHRDAFIRVKVLVHTHDLEQDLGVVLVKLDEEIVVCYLKQRLQAGAADVHNVLLCEPKVINLAPGHVFGDIRAQKQGNLAFKVHWHQCFEHVAVVLPADFTVWGVQAEDLEHAFNYLTTL